MDEQMMLIGGVSVLFLGGLGYLAYVLMANRMKEKLGVDFEFEERAYKIGQEVPVKVHFNPKDDVPVTAVFARTYCQSASHRDVRNDEGHMETRTEYDIEYETEVSLSGKRVFNTGRAVTLEGDVKIDPQGHGTKRGGSLEREWFLEINIDIPRSPDIKVKRELQVNSIYS